MTPRPRFSTKALESAAAYEEEKSAAKAHAKLTASTSVRLIMTPSLVALLPRRVLIKLCHNLSVSINVSLIYFPLIYFPLICGGLREAAEPAASPSRHSSRPFWPIPHPYPQRL